MDRANRVDRLQERFDALKSLTAQVGRSLDPRELDELSSALEQLQLTEIEMRHQNAELAAARDALEAERSRYRDLFELAPDAYLITNEHGMVIEANRAAGQLLNVERKFLIGKPLQDFVPPEDRSGLSDKVLEAQRAHAPLQWRMRITSRGAALVDVAAAVAPVTDRRNEPAGLRWSLRDISGQVRDEARLNDVNAALIVREHAARDAAEEASRSRDEFLATISHELRTPLNVVLGWTYRMRSHTLDAEESERAVAIIDRNARQQLHLVEDLLDSARIATGQLELDLGTHELGPLLRTAVETLHTTAAARRIAITTAIGEGIYVRADPVRMRQIIWNLLSNALKFTADRGTIHASLKAEHEHAVIELTDSGIGIPAPALQVVFEPFWQAEKSTRRARSGLGLGLAIVKHLVELHGGEVDAASSGAGHGTTFTVRLPLMRAMPAMAR